MKATGIVRHVDEMGRLVVPKSIRTKLGLSSGSAVEFFVEGDQVILGKFSSVCIFCDSTEDLSEFSGRSLCKACIEKIKNNEA